MEPLKFHLYPGLVGSRQFFLISTPGALKIVLYSRSQYKYPTTTTATTNAPMTNDFMVASLQIRRRDNAGTGISLRSLRLGSCGMVSLWPAWVKRVRSEWAELRKVAG